DWKATKHGIAERDFDEVGHTAEANCLNMHATTLGARLPFTYWTVATVAVMQAVQTLRDNGSRALFTIDAGPNVKVLYLPENEIEVEKALRDVPEVTDVILSRSGQGISYN